MLQNKPQTAEEFLIYHMTNNMNMTEEYVRMMFKLNIDTTYGLIDAMQEYLKHHIPFIIKAVQDNAILKREYSGIGEEIVLDKQSIEYAINNYVKENVK